MKIKKHKLTMLLALLSLFIFPIAVKAEVNNNAIMYYNNLPENVRAFVGTKKCFIKFLLRILLSSISSERKQEYSIILL